ncbi:hypothetical protein [Actinomadura opuntiae]|uniref:hypothetical protein n=1 Tax=Actinomadura sp. OS1-43 TaxID=604315 RepID=UPI00255AE97D|nr:hypothetical protein [Actinomadura sp. OS1-43]MDL4813124.1 hypothetical protein [Actinomadura sp. OS1-43]
MALTPEHERIAREAFAHADALTGEVERAFPRAWELMDHMRTNPPMQWPDWCLLPMGAADVVTGRNPAGAKSHTIAQVSALYNWRFARSVWIFEPALMSRFLTQVPDTITLDDLTTLPEWCVFIAGSHPEYPGSGLWAHLEYDTNTGRPELRLLLDLGETPLPIPVYLDRGSVTEALADYRATVQASIGRTGANVHGGSLDASVARLAKGIDAYLGILAYLARPEADIVHASRGGARPVKPRRPKRDRDIWLVGYTGTATNAYCATSA